MTAIKYTQTNNEISYKNRVLPIEAEKKLFKFHWYVEYMLVGMGGLIAIVKTIDHFFFELPEYFFMLNVDFVTAFSGIVIGIILARVHARKIKNSN